MSEGDEELQPSVAISQAIAERNPALRDLLAAQYESLLALARRIHSREPPNSPVSPSSLVHEAFLRLCGQSQVAAAGETFFRACMAQEFRRVLVDHARRTRALRRGGAMVKVTLDECSEPGDDGGLDILHVDEAMAKLASFDSRMASIVELRVFGRMTIAECAEVLGVSPRTINSEWAFARAWLQRQLS